MRIGIIDADLIGKKKHRFPNLACMKLSGYHKKNGDNVELLTDWWTLGYDRVYVSKVFTDTEVPGELLSAPNVICGGTGFYYDKAPDLPYEIEHSFPDYHLYDDWVQSKLTAGGKPKDYVYYTDYSIGFLTRGCFRKCEFCVNKNYDRCVPHSPLSEFLDPERKKICFLDDNFFACSRWESLIADVIASGKPFQFKQGLDERLLTDKKIHALMHWKYDGDYIFAFDDISDRQIIEKKLSRVRELYPRTKAKLKFYVLCGYDRSGRYGKDFWEKDIADTFERIRILGRYNAYPYVMRYEKAYTSKYSGIYSNIATWANQPAVFRKLSFREFCIYCVMRDKYSEYKNDLDGWIASGGRYGSTWRYMDEFEREYPDIAKEYFD